MSPARPAEGAHTALGGTGRRPKGAPVCAAALRCGARIVLAAVLAAGCTCAALAHKASDAYLTWRVDGPAIEQRLDIALRDLDRELGLDADDDGALSWGEVRGRWPEIEALAADAVRVTVAGAPCALTGTAAPQLDEHTDGRYAVLRRSLRCPQTVDAIEVDYRLFATSDATHRGLVRLVGAGSAASAALPSGSPDEPFGAAMTGAEQTAVLVPASGVQRLAIVSNAAPQARHFAGFVMEGMHHIAIGLDHILFLVTLLLVAVWRREGSGWVARESAASAWREALKLVSAFTVAHSLTLALATSGVLAPPSRWIESLIAASVLVAAVDNLRPFFKGPRWMMVALFGLVHGFGFAGPLQALGLEPGRLALPLLGFNLGVEIGQLALVAVLLPLACALRSARFYRIAVVGGGSALIVGMAGLWLVERSLDISLLP